MPYDTLPPALTTLYELHIPLFVVGSWPFCNFCNLTFMAWFPSTLWEKAEGESNEEKEGAIEQSLCLVKSDGKVIPVVPLVSSFIYVYFYLLDMNEKRKLALEIYELTCPWVTFNVSFWGSKARGTTFFAFYVQQLREWQKRNRFCFPTSPHWRTLHFWISTCCADVIMNGHGRCFFLHK